MTEKPSTATSFEEWWERDGMRIRALISDHGKGLARDAWNAALAARPSTDVEIDKLARFIMEKVGYGDQLILGAKA